MLIRKTMLMSAAGALTVAALAGPARAVSLAAEPLSAEQPADTASRHAAGSVVRMIDARDLLAVLPTRNDVDVMGTTRTAMSQVKELVFGIGRALDLQAEPLADGVFVVKGPEDAQGRMVQLLEQVRDLYRGQYELEMACYSVPATTPPDIGAAATVDNAPIRVRQAVTRRVETKLEASKAVTMIVKWQPVVGADIVGYDAQTSDVQVGLQTSVLVGAGADSAADAAFSIDLRIRGEISDVQVKELSVPLLGESKGGLPLQLPTVIRRSISADARVGTQSRVVGVVPGLKEGELLVVAASVRPVKK